MFHNTRRLMGSSFTQGNGTDVPYGPHSAAPSRLPAGAFFPFPAAAGPLRRLAPWGDGAARGAGAMRSWGLPGDSAAPGWRTRGVRAPRSEERRVGKGCRTGRPPDHGEEEGE